MGLSAALEHPAEGGAVGGLDLVVSGVSSGLPELSDPFGPIDGPEGGGGVDLSSWGLPAGAGQGLDQGGRLIVAAALVALADAGLPLRSSPGAGSALLDGRTAVVVVSRFAGLGGLVRRLTADPPMGAPPLGPSIEAALAALIGAKGPRLRLGGPDADPLHGLALAAAWLRSGAAERVVLAAADAPSDPGLPRWQGAPSGLLGHAVALVLEQRALAADRGCIPVAVLRAVAEGGATPAEAGLALHQASPDLRGDDVLVGDQLSVLPPALPAVTAALRVPAAERPGAQLAALLRALQFPAPGAARRFAVAQAEQGSPVVVLLERQAEGEARVSDAELRAEWLLRCSGMQQPMLVRANRSLRVVEGLFDEEEPSILPPARLAPPREEWLSPPSTDGLVERIGRALRAQIGQATGLAVEEVSPSHLLHAHLGLEDSTLERIQAAVGEELGVEPPPVDRELSVGELAAVFAGALSPAAGEPGERSAEERRAGPVLWRPVIVQAGGGAPGARPRGVRVIGEGGYADALRALVGVEDGPADVVLDAGSGLAESVREAAALDAAPPARWVCCTRLGADPAWVDPEVGQLDGARAGFARSLGLQWPGRRCQTIDVDPMLDDDEAAALLLGELARDSAEPLVYLDGPERRAQRLEREPAPPAGGMLREQPVILLVGDPAGLGGDLALALGRRGRVRLVLVPPTEGDGGLGAALEALDCELLALPADPLDAGALRAATVEARRRYGVIDGAIVVVEGDPSAEPSGVGEGGGPDLLHAHLMGTLPVRTLARELERVAWLLCVHRHELDLCSAADDAIDETLRRVSLSRPRTLHLAGEELDSGALARLCVDLVASGTSGSLYLADEVPARVQPSAHPLLTELRLGVDGEGALLSRGRAQLLGHRLRPLTGGEGPAQLPWSLLLELMAATGAPLRPGQPFVGALNLSFDAPVELRQLGLDGTAEALGDEARLSVELRASLESGGEVRCVAAQSVEGGPPLRVAECLLLFGDSLPYDSLPPRFFFSDEPIAGERVAALMPLGPALGGLAEATAIASDGLLAELVPDHRALGGEALLCAPAVLSGAVQAALLHHLLLQSRLAEPVSVSRLQLDHPPADQLPVGVLVQLSEDGLYDIDVDGPGGSVLRLRGLSLLDRGPAPADRQVEPPAEGWLPSAPQGAGG